MGKQKETTSSQSGNKPQPHDDRKPNTPSSEPHNQTETSEDHLKNSWFHENSV